MEDITPSLCHKLWGSEDCGWSFLPSEGNSGSILSLWNKIDSTLKFTFGGEGFVGVCLDWGAHHRTCFNVYSKYNLEAKRRLWKCIEEARRSLGEGAWCTLGDFNAVRNGDERRGVNAGVPSSQALESNLFNGFLTRVELDDLNLLGSRYTWYHPNDIAMSRIDRVLISEEWNQFWGATSLWMLPRDVSDHCLLVLKLRGWDWGPRPFRFNNFVLENKKFKGVVEDWWRNRNSSGWMSFVLKEKYCPIGGGGWGEVV